MAHNNLLKSRCMFRGALSSSSSSLIPTTSSSSSSSPLLLQRRYKGGVDVGEMRRAGISETTCFHEERKRLLEEPYHYADGGVRQDQPFNKRLDVFQEVYEGQEMDGTCRYLMNAEADAAEKKIYEMAVRSARPVVGAHRVVVMRRIEDARSRILRRYKGLDADLRCGDAHLEGKAEEYLRQVSIGLAKGRWDFAKAAHKTYAAQLQGSPKAEKEAEARAEIEGVASAEPDVLRTFEEVGFLEKEEFGMLRAELGEEAADEFIEGLQKTRAEVVAKRLQAISNQTKLNQLEKQLVLQDYKQVFSAANKYDFRKERGERILKDAEDNEAQYDSFMRERDMSGEEALNQDTHDMAADVRQRRAELLRQRREQQATESDTTSTRGATAAAWEGTAGLVQKTRSFVDPDWWELATDNPQTKRAYNKALKRDARAVRPGKENAVQERKDAADSVLDAMESFSDFRKDNFTRGYSRSQVCAPPSLLAHIGWKPRNGL